MEQRQLSFWKNLSIRSKDPIEDEAVGIEMDALEILSTVNQAEVVHDPEHRDEIVNTAIDICSPLVHDDSSVHMSLSIFDRFSVTERGKKSFYKVRIVAACMIAVKCCTSRDPKLQELNHRLTAFLLLKVTHLLVDMREFFQDLPYLSPIEFVKIMMLRKSGAQERSCIARYILLAAHHDELLIGTHGSLMAHSACMAADAVHQYTPMVF